MEQRGEKTRCCSQRQILSIATSKTAMVLGFIIVLGVYSSLQRKERIVTEITQVALDEPPVIHDVMVNSQEVRPKTKTIYVITPTYSRSTQHPDLTRMAQTLAFATVDIHWIVVEDAPSNTDWVSNLLNRTVPHSHTLLHCQRTTTSAYNNAQYDMAKRFGSDLPKNRPLANGVAQRNCALKWLIDRNITDGVMFFGDDDNSYDVRLFEELSTTEKLAIFPTGNFAGMGVSTVVVKKGKVVGFIDQWLGNRKFPVDMASFASNVGFWRSRGSPLMVDLKGYIEDCFLRALNITMDDMEPKSENCTKIYVWHTQTKPMALKKTEYEKNVEKYGASNVKSLMSEVNAAWAKTAS